MTEEDTQILRDIWQHLVAMSQRLDRLEAKLEAKIDQVAARVQRLEHRADEIDQRLGRNERLVDSLAERMADGFARVYTRFDELEHKTERRFDRVEARLDLIDGRLTTLNATVALHDLALKEATAAR